MTKSTGKRDIKRIFYSGDININYGGYFYNLSCWHWGYVDVVRVVPCTDMDGPDNLFYVQKLTVNLQKGAKLANVIRTCGFDSLNLLPKGAARKHALVDCHLSYGTYDVCDSELIQIGKHANIGAKSEYGQRDKSYFDATNARVLRGNTSIARYARSVLRDAL